MAAKTCACNASMSNTGIDCIPLIEVTKLLMYMPIYDSLGVRNYIDLTVTLNLAYFTALINQSDSTKRLYPLPELKDVKDNRDTPVVQSFPDGSQLYVRDGIRKFEGLIVGKKAAPVLKGNIEAARCNELGVFCVERTGGIVGTISSDGTKLYPTRMDSQSVSIMYVKSTDTTQQALNVMFNFHPDESDADLRIIQSTELAADMDALLLKGLQTVTGVFSSITATGATVKLNTQSGTPMNPVTVKGLLVANFVSTVGGATSRVRNNTSSADVIVSSVTESVTVPGTYVLVWASQTTAHKIAIFPKLNGFDFTAVAAAPVTIP